MAADVHADCTVLRADASATGGDGDPMILADTGSACGPVPHADNGPVSTFISLCLDRPGSGPRIAVKDVIDIAGVPTTAGCKALADTAAPAARDAACMAGARVAGAAIVGKANLHELAFGASGVNQWFGTPVNPLDPALLPGGSSSGSAVAVAEGSADIGYGTDTGGSVRIPAAFCGLAGRRPRSAGSAWTAYGRSRRAWTRSVRSRRTWPA